MTQAAQKLTLTEYLNLDAEDWVNLGLPEGRCVYIDGEVVEIPPESAISDRLALNLRDRLMEWVNDEWVIRVHNCELEMPCYDRKDPATCFPALVVLREEHLPLIEQRLLLRHDVSPPLLVVDIVNPEQPSYSCDYGRKRRQYAGRGIPECWLIDPQEQQVQVCVLVEGDYQEIGVFIGNERLQSPGFPGLRLTARQILNFVGSRLREEVQRAEQAEQQAEQERQRAEQAEQLAVQERQRAEQAEQRANKLQDYLRSLGIDPDRR